MRLLALLIRGASWEKACLECTANQPIQFLSTGNRNVENRWSQAAVQNKTLLSNRLPTLGQSDVPRDSTGSPPVQQQEQWLPWRSHHNAIRSPCTVYCCSTTAPFTEQQCLLSCLLSSSANCFPVCLLCCFKCVLYPSEHNNRENRQTIGLIKTNTYPLNWI